jgi:hypothetical protein
MLRDDASTLIQTLLGFRTDQASNIVTLMQTVQFEAENGPIKPWFLLSEDSIAVTTIGEERLAVPLDFLEEDQELPLRYRPTDWPTEDEIDLWKDSYVLLKRNFAPSTILPGTQQVPQAYALVGNYFRIFPTPDKEYNIRLIYYARATTLSSNITNGWLSNVPYFLIGKTGKLLAAALSNTIAFQTFDMMEKEGMDSILRENAARQEANKTPQMGGRVWSGARAGMLPPGVNPIEIDDGN